MIGQTDRKNIYLITLELAATIFSWVKHPPPPYKINIEEKNMKLFLIILP